MTEELIAAVVKVTTAARLWYQHDLANAMINGQRKQDMERVAELSAAITKVDKELLGLEH